MAKANTASVFEPAVKYLLENNLDCHLIGSFQKYIKENNFGNTKTAGKISVDSYEKLDWFLRKHNYMVFRLGKSSNGPGTSFALRKIDNKSDFFLIDKDIFGANYLDYSISEEELLPFRIIDRLTEQSYLNIAINSGMLAQSLGINKNIYSANTQSIYTFDFKLKSDDEQVLRHLNGQVEIDSVFANKRNGKKVVFIIEAKSDNVHKSLSKHKLVYSVLAVADKIPPEYEIVPIFLKITKESNYLYFKLAECSLPDPRTNLVSIEDLSVKCSQVFRVGY